MVIVRLHILKSIVIIRLHDLHNITIIAIPLVYVLDIRITTCCWGQHISGNSKIKDSKYMVIVKLQILRLWL